MALSYHMLKKYDPAIKVIDAFMDSYVPQKDGEPIDYEISELLLYKNLIIQESGDMGRALRHLDSIEGKVCDKRALRLYRARLSLKLGSRNESNAEYYSLFKENPECWEYLHGFLLSKGLDTLSKSLEVRKKITHTMVELQKEFPRSHMLERKTLDFASDETFMTLADKYLCSKFRKGVPSVFANVKDLMSDESKILALLSIVDKYAQAGMSRTADSPELPSTVLWSLYFLSQMHDKTEKYDDALEAVELAIKHTPTLVELHMFKARIYKHMGNYKMAAAVMDSARNLDLQDRFMNTKSTKYHIRADDIPSTESTISLFTRQGSAEEKLSDLTEMQCMWYIIEVGESWVRQEQFGKALKKFHQIAKFFDDIIDDQFDFHTYCLRKITLRSYVALIRDEDIVQKHPYYVRAVKNAVKIYTVLHDKRAGMTKEQQTKELEISEAEKKKLLSKQRRAAAQSKEAAMATTADKSTGDDDDEVKKPVKDLDPDGLNLIDPTTDYMAEALKLVAPLQIIASDSINTHLLSFEIYFRQNKVLLAHKAIHHAVRCLSLMESPANTYEFAQVKYASLRMDHQYDSVWKPNTNAVSREIIEGPFEYFAFFQKVDLMSGVGGEISAAVIFKSIQSDDFIKRKPGTPLPSTIVQKLCDVVPHADFKLVCEIDEWFKEMEELIDKSVLVKWQALCRLQFPQANRFMTETDLLALDVQLMKISKDNALSESEDSEKTATEQKS